MPRSLTVLATSTPAPTGDAAKAVGPAMPLLRLGVSACLLGDEVRYNGGHSRDDFVAGVLDPWV